MLKKYLIALPLIWAIQAFAQNATQNSNGMPDGMISDTVLDVNGGLVPGATVKLEGN